MIDKSTTAETGMLNCGQGIEGNDFDIRCRVSYGHILVLKWCALDHLIDNKVLPLSRLMPILSNA